MSGTRSKTKTGRNKNQENKTQDEERGKAATIDNTASMEESGSEEENLTTTKAIKNLSKEIQTMYKELKRDIMDFKNDMKQEFINFRTEMNQKIQDVASDVRNHGTRLTEAEQRVEETETANIDLRDALLDSLKQQKLLQDKVTDLEGRSRRNNIRIYGIKEGTEGNSMLTFIDNFLKTELALDGTADLQIQRAHRSIGPKPRDEAVSRSILVNFQRYDTKDKILKTAWSKKIICDGKPVSFAHDLPTEINNRLREYRDIKKILKEKKIRFQTPYPARMRIHWENGPCLYNSAAEAAEDMRKRGFQLDLPLKSTTNWEQKLTEDTRWSRKDGDRATRVRERLREFNRQ